nr:DEAD/DEAH box helicase family protein [Corynebacterium lactis]
MAINPFWHTFSRMLSGFPDADVRAMVDSPEATDDYVYRAELELARRGYFYDDTAPPTEVEQHIAAVAFGKIALDDLSDNQAEAIYNYFTNANERGTFTGPADTMLTPLQAWAYDATSLIVADRVAADPSHYVEQLRSGQTDSPLVRDALLPHLGHDLLLEAWAEGYVRRTATDTPAIALVDSEVGDLDDETLSASHAALIEASKGAPVHIRPVLDEIASEAYAELTNRTEHFDTGEATYVVTTTSPEEASQCLGQALSFVPPAQSLAPRGPKGRARANIDAIRLVAQLDTDNRWPTADEQRILAAYSGWGGASQIFDKNNTQWTKEYGELLDALPEGVTVTDLSSSVNTAFYTAPGVTKAMWDALETAGFSGGEVLEPGCGIGGFIGAAPETAHMTGVELDPIASRISSLLYPTDTVVNQSFTKLSTESKPFSAAIGNVPFNKDDKPHDPRYNPKGLSVHNYFISKSTELVQPGGYIALITSVSTSDAAMPTARKQITTNADVVTAVRLPEETFRTVAGTSVISDLLVLRVREPGQVPDERTLQWLSTENISLGSTTLTTNSFFAANPGNIIGTQSVGYDRFKEPIMRVNADEDTIAPQLSEILTREITAAVASGRGHTVPAVTNAQREALSEFTTVNATAEPIPGTITYTRDADGTYHFTQYEANGTWVPVTVAKAYHREWAELIDLREAEKTLQDAYKEDKGVAQAQQRLHSLYDAYLAAHGPINRFEIQPGRAPSATAQNKAFQALAADWRAANGYEPGDPLPDDTETLLREQAAEAVPKKVQKHLGKLRDDPDMQRVLALEVFDEGAGTATKSALFFRNPARTTTRPTHADSLPDAISIARSETGGLDLRRIAELTDRDVETVTDELLDDGLAFRDPASPDELIDRGDYLSGFVADKLATARLAAETDPRLRANVTELLAVQPPEITDFAIRPGATWIPTAYYEQFAAEKLGAAGWSRLKISRGSGEWKVSVDSTYWAWGGNADMAYGLVVANNRAGKTYNFQATGQAREATNQGVGCNRKDGVAVPAFKTFEAILNLSAPQASWSKEWVESRGIKPGTHGQATAFLARKAQALQEEFSDWVMSDPGRAREVTRAYNKAFNGFVPRTYDGSARALPGLGDKFTPYDYQRNAVERIVNEPAVLLNHVVGAGKTGTMFMAAAELKRLGLAHQPWMVVPNHIADQVTREAIQWYPGAQVLSAAGISDKTGRARFIAQTASRDWDLVIVPQSVFELIPVDAETQIDYFQGQLATTRRSLTQAKATADGAKTPTVKQIEGAVKRMENHLEKLLDSPRDQTMTINQTPCDYLIVDEAHMYKNLMRTSQVSDLSHPGSKKASDLDMKLQWLRAAKAERGTASPVATFATGTPIANNLAEIWVMAKYLRPDVCQSLGIDDVNAFGATFTEQVSDVEVKPSGTGLRQKVRTAAYTNIAELANASSLFMDVVTTDDITARLPRLASGASNRVIEFDVEQEVKDFIHDLGVRSDYDWDADPDRRRTASALGRNVTGPEIDMALKIASDGRKVTLDGRLAGLTIDGPGSRVGAVATTIIDQWNKTKDRTYTTADGSPSPKPGGVQIVFCDTGTPGGAGFSIYDAIRDELTARGMDRTRIAFVHEWDKDKATLFQKCNDGDIDVVIGSTAKMGTGANLQRRAVALHHVDIPWKPADLTQREGRIMRQGNQNDEVEIFNYVAAGTFDAVMWQTLYRKQRFIDQFTAADRDLRDMDALDDSAAQAAAHNKAIATGDPRYVDLLNLDKQVGHLQSLRQEWESSQAAHRHAVDAAQWNIRRAHSQLDQLTPHLDEAAQWASAAENDTRTWTTSDGHTTTDRETAARSLASALAAIAHARNSARAPLMSVGDVAFTARYDYSDVEVGLADAEEVVRFRVSVDEIAEAITPTIDDKVSTRAWGLLTRLENRVGDITRTHARLSQDLEVAECDLSRLNTAPAAAPFAHRDELADAIARRDDLREELRKENTSEKAKRLNTEREQRMAARGREPMWTLELSPTEGYAKAVHATEDRNAVIRQAKTREATSLRDSGLISDIECERRVRAINPAPTDDLDADIDYDLIDDDTLTALAIEYPSGISHRMREEIESRGIAVSAAPATSASAVDRQLLAQRLRDAVIAVAGTPHQRPTATEANNQHSNTNDNEESLEA